MSDAIIYQQIAERLVRAGYDPTKAGDAINWLIKALHPAWGGTCTTIPDHALVPSVCPDYTVSETFGTPTIGQSADWDCMIIKVPGDVTGAIIVRGIPGCDFEAAAAVPTVPTDQNQVLVSYLRTQQVEEVEISTPYVPYATLNSLPPSPSDKTVTYLPALRPAGSRPRYSGLTVYPVSSDLYNQGTIYAGQFARPSSSGYSGALRGLGREIVPGSSATDWVMAHRVTTDIPFHEAQMQLLDPSAVAWPYKNGAYCPVRFLDPTVDFHQPKLSQPATLGADFGPGGVVTLNVGGNTLPQHVATQWSKLPTNAGRPPPWMYNIGLGQGSIAYDAFDSNTYPLSVPVVICRGLASQASITVRVYCGIEYLPSLESPVLAFTKVAAPPAPNVIALYHAIVHELNRSVWPSSYNSLGSILNTILSVAKTVLPVIATAAGFVPHPIGQMVSMGARALGAGAAAAHAALDARGNTRPPARVLAAPLSSGGGGTSRLLLPPAVRPQGRRKRRAVVGRVSGVRRRRK